MTQTADAIDNVQQQVRDLPVGELSEVYGLATQESFKASAPELADLLYKLVEVRKGADPDPLRIMDRWDGKALSRSLTGAYAMILMARDGTAKAALYRSVASFVITRAKCELEGE